MHLANSLSPEQIEGWISLIGKPVHHSHTTSTARIRSWFHSSVYRGRVTDFFIHLYLRNNRLSKPIIDV